MQLELNTITDSTPLNLTEEKKQEILNIVQQIDVVLSLLVLRIEDGIQNNDVSTCLGRIERRLADLSRATGYEGVLKAEVEKRHAEVRKLNYRIRELKEQRGKEINAAAATAALQRYEIVFRTWYEACGLRYANIEYGICGFRAKFSSRLRRVREKKLWNTRNGEMFARFVKMTPFLPESEDYDVIKDANLCELADTDKNRQNLIRLFTEAFPNVTIYGFEVRKNDCGSFFLGIDVYIPYGDVEGLEKAMKR